MEMNIDSKLIIKLRKEKGWSQHHLSVVSGVSLRTIQRVENEGNTSVETLKSLASAFETNFNNLICKPPLPNKVWKKATVPLALLFSLVMSIFLTSTTTASPGVEIQAEEMSVSRDGTQTIFLGQVSMIIPPAVPFEISTIESDSDEDNLVHQLKITTETSSFLVLDARISRINEGLEIRAAEMRAVNATDE